MRLLCSILLVSGVFVAPFQKAAAAPSPLTAQDVIDQLIMRFKPLPDESDLSSYSYRGTTLKGATCDVDVRVQLDSSQSASILFDVGGFNQHPSSLDFYVVADQPKTEHAILEESKIGTDEINVVVFWAWPRKGYTTFAAKRLPGDKVAVSLEFQSADNPYDWGMTSCVLDAAATQIGF